MRIIYLLAFAILTFSINAQTYIGATGNRNASIAEIMPIDKSIMECIYSYKIYDPELEESRESYKILEVGKNYSKFSSYGAYRVDSIIKADYPTGITINEFFGLDKTYHPTREFIIKDIKKCNIQSYDKVFMDKYVYEEKTPEIKWELAPETKIICGYDCQKATAEFRGRHWTTWYCDLPINNGPWKFGNLPGLILKIEDENLEHIFEAISIRNSDNEFGITKGSRQKTSREKFNKALYEYKTKPGNFISGSPLIPKDNDGKDFVPNNRMFFNPIEKE